MKRILTPAGTGLGAARHLVWYLSYRISGTSQQVR